MKILPTLLAGTCLIVASSAYAQANDQHIAQRLLDSYLAAWSRADAHAIGAFYTNDGTFINPNGDHFVGPDRISGFYEGAFARGYAGRRATAFVTIDHEGAEQMAAEGRWRIEAPLPPASEAPAECGTFSMSARRIRGAWRVTFLREVAEDCSAPEPIR